jgi:hypothetical protein
LEKAADESIIRRLFFHAEIALEKRPKALHKITMAGRQSRSSIGEFSTSCVTASVNSLAGVYPLPARDTPVGAATLCIDHVAADLCSAVEVSQAHGREHHAGFGAGSCRQAERRNWFGAPGKISL